MNNPIRTLTLLTLLTMFCGSLHAEETVQHEQHQAHKHEDNDSAKRKHQWSQVSESGLITAEVFPQQGKPVFNDYHNWVIKLSDAKGQPVSDAKIAIDGGMEAHGHGLPSKPVISRELDDGEYLIEGMLFNMTGAWTLVIDVLSTHENARFTFPLELSH